MRKLVFIIIFYIVCGLTPFFADAADGRAGLFLRPAQGSFFVGSTFDVSIVLDTKSIAVNTVEVELLFPPDKVQIVNPSVGTSLVQVWAAPPLFSNKEGKIYFVGGIPSPGIETSQGVVLTLTFRAISPGEAKLEFGPKTSVLANDAFATDILGQSPPAFFKFAVPPPQGPTISSPTHSDQDLWHKDPNPIFIWSKSQFSNSFSYSIDQDPSGFPDTISDGKTTTATFQDLESGIWYFHLREEAGKVWGGVSHYVVKIDKDLPASFDINISPGLRTSNKNPIFRFFTTDSLSGLDHFELKIIPLSHGDASDGLFFETTSPYQASNLKSGRNQVVVRAVDKAGNIRDASQIITVVTPLTRILDTEGINLGFMFISWSNFIAWLFFAFLVAVLVLLGLWSRHKHHIVEIFWKDTKRAMHFIKKNRSRTALIMLLPLCASLFIPTQLNALELEKEIIPPPIISVTPERYYPVDDILYIEGKAFPHSQVEILFERVSGGASPLRVTVQSNSAGDWFLSEKEELASGEWYVRARILNDPPSDWSNPRIIRSVVSGFVIGKFKVKYLPVATIIALLLLGSLTLFIYLLLRTRAAERAEIEKKMRQKTEDLEQQIRDKEKIELDLVIEHEFEDLRRGFIEELKHIELRANSAGSLSPEEEQHRSDILKKLGEIEIKIEEKIKNLS